jgi:YbbR domain-containing protein
MKEFLQNFFLKNWQYKLGALITAVVLWFYVASEQNLTVVLNIPIQLDNFPSDMKISNKPENSADLTVTGRRDIVNNINKKEILISLDLKNARQGKNTFRITSGVIHSLPRGLEIKSISPYQVEVELQKGGK